MLRSLLALSRLLPVLGLLAACATAPEPAARSEGPPQPPLNGTAWVLAELSRYAFVLPGTAVTLRFEGGQVQGHDGCNRYTAPYASMGSTLRVTGPVVATQIACAASVAGQARTFQAALASTRAYRVTGSGERARLHLLGNDGLQLATLRPQQLDLMGHTWQVLSLNNGQGAVVGVVADAVADMAFGPDGRLTGSTGCNRFHAAYEVSGDRWRIEQPAATRRLCEQPAGVMEQERRLLAALPTVVSARAEGNRLELRDARGALAVLLVRADR